MPEFYTIFAEKIFSFFGGWEGANVPYSRFLRLCSVATIYDTVLMTDKIRNFKIAFIRWARNAIMASIRILLKCIDAV